MGKLINQIGNRFGRLLVVARDGSHHNHARWKCLCDCGKEISSIWPNLRNGTTTSCGCYRKEAVARNKFKHGDAPAKSQRRLYVIWCNMKQRCLNHQNPKFVDYGGRGITICDDWINSYPSFKNWSLKNGYQANLSIDRINNDSGYRPENCRWTTASVQNSNKRNSIKYRENTLWSHHEHS